jgi:5-methylcytosine-specific restriction protein A
MAERRGRCSAHARAVDRRRLNAQDRGYDARWQRIRRSFLQRHPLCGMRLNGQRPIGSQCFDEGRTTAASYVDHQVPHRGDEVLFCDEANFCAMCSQCHHRKTASGR